jgi:hypothetical protein
VTIEGKALRPADLAAILAQVDVIVAQRCAPLVEALEAVKRKCEWTRSYKDNECIAIIDKALAAYRAQEKDEAC